MFKLNYLKDKKMLEFNDLYNPPRISLSEIERRIEEDYWCYAICYFNKNHKRYTIPYLLEDEVDTLMRLYLSQEELNFRGISIIPMFFLDANFYDPISLEVIDEEYIELFKNSKLIELDYM